MNYHRIIFLCLCVPNAYAMRKPELDNRKTSSADNTPRRESLPLISHALEESKKSSSATSSPRCVLISAAASSEKEPKKSSSAGGSPSGPRFSGVRSMGRRDSKELIGSLKEEFVKIDSEELKARFEKAQKGSKILLQKKELELLACAKIKNAEFNDVTLKKNAADLVFNANAHEIMIALQNRLTYLNQKNQQEAHNQWSRSIKLFFEQKDLLVSLGRSEETTLEPHVIRWNALLKMVPIILHMQEHLQKDAPKESKKLEEYQEAIKEEHFLPK